MQTPSSHFLKQRRFDIDAIRVMAFAILIFYHVGMFYVLDWGWHIKSQYQFQWLQHPMMFFNQWRMALLFVISGMATAILMHKYQPSSSAGFLRERLSKLGVPLLFGIFVIVVPQAYFEARANQAFAGNYLSFWYNYVTFGEWQSNAFSGSEFGFTWNHLWYLPYIMFYTLLTVVIRNVVKGAFPGFSANIASGALWQWYTVMLSVLLLAGLFVFPLFPERTHALFDDWYTHSLFFSFFALGYFLIRSAAIWQSLKKFKWWLLLLACFSYAAFRMISDNFPDDGGLLWELSQLVLVYLNRLSWILVILGFAYGYLNRDSVLLRYCNRAVFSWYILHQSITVVLGAWLSPLNLGASLELPLVLVGTILGCIAIHHFLVRPFSFLHPVMGYGSNATSLAQPSEPIDSSLKERNPISKPQ